MLGPIPRIIGAVATSPFVSQQLRVLSEKRSLADLNQLADLVATGTLTPVIERTCPLADTADAIRRLEADHARGKTVLTV